MDAANEIKRLLTMRQVAEFYGFQVRRSGFIPCPFHRGDHQASLKIYDGERGFHCFGCGAHGSVIDFAMKLFGLSFRQALIRLSSDFRLGITGSRIAKPDASRILEERRERQEQEEAEREAYYQVAAEYRRCLEAVKFFGPDTYCQTYIHPLYAEAVKRLPYLEYWLDEHLGGDRN